MKLLILGLGYSAGFFARAALARGWEVTGTVRSAERAAELSREGIRTLVFGGFAVSTALAKAVAEAEAVLVSVQPAEDGDPVLQRLRGDLAAAPALRWIGYLSTIGVYGNQDGAWIDETQPVKPGNARNTLRVAIEQDWLALGRDTGKAVQIFRLAGIYGPGRNPVAKLREGKSTRLVKPGQVFNRIHVDDIAAVIQAAAERQASGVFNVADNEPAPPQDVVAFAAALAGYPPLPDIPFETAQLSPMARSFYADNKRIANGRLARDLGVTLRYPTYRDALTALWADGSWR